jgi:malate dehydrogenase (oxaloacetate-decarboxylating)
MLPNYPGPAPIYHRPVAVPSAQFSLTLRVALPQRASGALSRVTSAITRAGGSIVAVDAVETRAERGMREITVECSSVDHRGEVIRAVQGVSGAELVEITDRTFEVHRRGKIHTGLNMPVKSRDDLSMAYTPGVARVCTAIAENRQKAFKYTIKANTVAVVSDGTAVLGLGDIGPEAAMPVMEGKAMLFKEFADVDAFPICLDTKDADEIVETVIRISPTFGGINLEDISSPRCFEIEQRLKEALDIPVFHDDQHGTAIVTLAALINGCRLTGRRMEDLGVLMVGAGAAGVAVAKILMDAGVTAIVACDRFGAIHTGRDDYVTGSMNSPKRWLADNTNPEGRGGTPREVIEGTDLFIGLSGPGIIDAADLKRMNPDPFVFAMANPNPEVRPEDAAPHVRLMATGRSDYPNQINNVLAFPGVFRGALDARATAITEEMKLAAAQGIASVVEDDELDEDYIIPSVFNRDVSRAVADAVRDVAERSSVAAADPEQPTVERAAVS